MPDYTIRDPRTGRTLTVRGEGGPPTEAELEQLFASQPAQNETAPTGPRQPASAEQFMSPKDIENRDMTAMDVVKGAAKGVGRSALGIADMAARTGMFPGMAASLETVRPTVNDYTAYKNPAQELGGTLETVAEVALPVIRGSNAVARAIPGGIRTAVTETAKVMADERSLLTQARQKVAKAVLSKVLDFSKKPVAGARIVPKSGDDLSTVLSDALEEARAPQAASHVELPPAVRLPPGYAPRTSAPAPTPQTAAAPVAPVAPAPQGRLVPAAPRPTAEQVAAEALAETRSPSAPAMVSTPPPAQLPPGYQPRTTVPKPKPAKMAAPAPQSEPPKRAYFLKSPEEIAAARASVPPPVAPTGSITVNDLPASWKQHTGQDLFPTTGAEGKEIRAALMEQIKESGMSVGEAIAAVSKNRDISTAMRTQLIRALSGGR